MTFFELIFFCMYVVPALLCGKALGAVYGPWGWFGGIVLDTFAVWLGFRLLGLLNDWWLDAFPFRPPCRNNKCKQYDYKLIKVTPGSSLYACLCGDKYLRDGKCFDMVLEDDVIQPYMYNEGFLRRWHPKLQ
jgi:hypothetical protein